MSKQFFKVSSGLKDIIGNELITDKYVAIFELVKNSFDAGATRVDITFENIYKKGAKIIIQDNGKGMDRDDILNKWLFVAYSAKKDNTEDTADYRKNVHAQRHYAGAKGVGRFSCDRLGKHLNLYSKKKSSGAQIETIEVDWTKFEKDQKEEFIKIPVELNSSDKSSYNLKHGTVLEISQVPKEWDRASLILLKEKLSKLVRPDALKQKNEQTPFKIFLHVKEEVENDVEIKRKDLSKGKLSKGKGYVYRNTINGEIQNFIFEDLDIKTTKIISTINQDGTQIETSLIDRGVAIYTIREKNSFALLKDIQIVLYYLNRSAKTIFGKKVGVEPVNFGNVFVYKNGFRIYPYGEPDDDSLGLNERALQGFKRYIGTRSLIGQIEIFGDNLSLRETTSRDGGLVKSLTFLQLTGINGDSFLVRTLRRLEKYVVDVTEWGIDTDENIDNLSKPEAKEKLVKLIANIIDDKAVTYLNYDKNFIKLVGEQQSNSARKILSSFKRIATESKDEKLLKDTKRLEKTLGSALSAKESAEKETQQKELEKKKVEEELEEQVKETLFARAVVGTDAKDLLSIQHHINRSAAGIINELLGRLVQLVNSDSPKEQIIETIKDISLENQKIITLSKFVNKANFDTYTPKLQADIVTFVNEYVLNVYLKYDEVIRKKDKLSIHMQTPKGLNFVMTFRPIEIIIIIDNILNNAVKAKATKVDIVWEAIDDKFIVLKIRDNGSGISDSILPKIFEFRFSTTNGSGLGLYHVKQVVEQRGGTIEVNNKLSKGVEFAITFKR